MKKEKKKIFVIVGAVVACLAVVYVGFGIFFQSHFCFGTTIDGIKAGGKSVEKVEQLITEEIDSYVLNLAEREDGSESISGESIQIAPVFNLSLIHIFNDGEAIEVKCQFCNKAYHFEVDELKEMRK